MTARIRAKAEAVRANVAHAAPATFVYGAFRAAAMKAAIFSGLFTPGESSTPEEASTKWAPETWMARAMFSELRPPARPKGRLKLRSATSCQSNAEPQPPGRVADASALASNRR